MKTLFIVGHPTQFEGPFFQYVQKTKPGFLEVVYFDENKFNKIYDEEVGRTVDFGIDIKSGYSYSVLPANNMRSVLRSIIKKGDYDLIIVNGYTRWPLIYSIFYGMKFRKEMALRLDTVEFTLPGVIRKMYKRALFSILKNIFVHFFVTGTLSKEFLLRQGVQENRISVFSYVVDNLFFEKSVQQNLSAKDEFKKSFGLTPDSYVVLVVSKLCPREIPWDVIKAINTVTSTISEAHLIIVGDGPSRMELEKYCVKQGLANVTFAGYVQYVNLAQYYSIADLFVHASINEPWGVSVQEAMASGLPVIASSQVGAAVDLIRAGQNGYIYEQGNAGALASRIVDIYKLLSKNDVKECNNQILERWSYESTLMEIQQAGLSIIERRMS